jgi:hypothetical protein
VIKPKDEEYRMLFDAGEGDYLENAYWSDLRYGPVHRVGSAFEKFWRRVKFGDSLEVPCHEFLFNRDTAGPQTVVYSGLGGVPLV